MQVMATVHERDRVLIMRTQRHQSDWVLVAVEDVGIGIEPEYAHRLPAFHTTKADGLGMGLSMPRAHQVADPNGSIAEGADQTRKRSREAVRDGRWNEGPISNYRRLDE